MSDTTTGTITDEGVERLRARIGVPEPWTRRPHYLRPNTDAFRIVAESYGDDNPLWCDPEHATASVWGGPLAPPPLVGGDSLVGEDEVTAVPDDQRALMKGDPLRGVHAFYSASAREWWAPLRADRRVWRRNAMVAVLDKPSEFAGRAVHEWSANVFRDDEGAVLSGQYRLMIRTERKKAREKKKYDAIEPAVYTDDEIDEIDAEYAAASRRGPEPRFWEDVDEGDTIGPMVKGPLLVTDMVCWHVGMGMGLYDVKPLALGAANRRRIPRFFKRDDQNIPDVQQRVHWDPEWARRAGNPTTYDYGRMRETWLIHLCTDWMGDDAWLWKLECSFRGFNYVGDTHHLTGTIVRKYLADGDRPAVDLELAATNQRGTVTTPGTASVLLPSREHGPVKLPDPPGTDLESSLTAVSGAFSTR
ncbi:MAG TPA: hypothetical protein VFW97_05165 [Acidimicrobiia bacterium]|nr:hypothetical protein [Acidimicrobiia bacterium]